MITFIIGQSGAGKTTLSNSLGGFYKNCIKLDGDEMRKIWTDLGFSKKDRWEQNLRVARLARMLNDQGFNVVVSMICPYKKLRAEVKKIIDCKFIYIEGGLKGKKYPFEHPDLI